jgi:hypothetical protein
MQPVPGTSSFHTGPKRGSSQAQKSKGPRQTPPSKPTKKENGTNPSGRNGSQDPDKKKKGSSKERMKAKKHAFRPPEGDEDGKRIIFGKPHEWDPERKWWDPVDAPPSGANSARASYKSILKNGKKKKGNGRKGNQVPNSPAISDDSDDDHDPRNRPIGGRNQSNSDGRLMLARIQQALASIAKDFE